MSLMSGRVIRILAGIVLIWLGLFIVGGVGGIILAIVGLAPLGRAGPLALFAALDDCHHGPPLPRVGTATSGALGSQARIKPTID